MSFIKEQILQPGQPDYLGYLYSLVVAAGGIAGYMKAGSMASLGMGLLMGGTLGFGAYLVSQNRNNVLLPTIASGILTGVMGSRSYRTGSFMPAGIVAGISLLMFLRYGQQFLKK